MVEDKQEQEVRAPGRHGLSDTPDHVEALRIEAFRRMGPQARLERALRMSHALRQLAESRIRAEHGPELSDREVRLRIAALHVPREQMIRLLGWDPDEEGL